MTNQQTIKTHAEDYIYLYYTKFGVAPTSWFSFFAWLASFTPAGSFNDSDIAYAKELLANA